MNVVRGWHKLQCNCQMLYDQSGEDLENSISFLIISGIVYIDQ